MRVLSVDKQIIFVLLSLALAQLACSFGTRVSQSSAGQPTQAGSSVTGSCANDYLPVKPGATWTYSGQGAAGNFTRVSTIASVETNSFERQVVTTLSSGTQRTYTDSWECTPDGLILQGGPLANSLNDTYGNAIMKIDSTTGVTLPANISAGNAWSQNSQLTFTSPQVSVPMMLTYNLKAIGLKSVTVPAGTFNAMKVQVTTPHG